MFELAWFAQLMQEIAASAGRFGPIPDDRPPRKRRRSDRDHEGEHHV